MVGRNKVEDLGGGKMLEGGRARNGGKAGGDRGARREETHMTKAMFKRVQ
jgi:hypothetical protein